MSLVQLDDSSTHVNIVRNGSFSITDLKPTTYSIAMCCLKDSYLKSVRVGGRDVSTSTIDLRAGNPGPVEFTVAPNAAKITGFVRLADGNPVSVVSVRLWPAHGGRPEDGSTDTTGVFLFEGLAPGDYYLAAAEDTSILMSEGFRTAFESQLTKVSVREGSLEMVDVKFITSEETEEAVARLP